MLAVRTLPPKMQRNWKFLKASITFFYEHLSVGAIIRSRAAGMEKKVINIF